MRTRPLCCLLVLVGLVVPAARAEEPASPEMRELRVQRGAGVGPRDGTGAGSAAGETIEGEIVEPR